MAYPHGPYEPPPPYNPTADTIPQGPGWAPPHAPASAPSWAPPPAPTHGGTVFNPDAQNYVKQGSTYYAAGANPTPGGFYPTQTQPPMGGYYPQQQGYGAPMPPQGGYYPGQPVTAAPGYYGAAGYPVAPTTTIVQERQTDNRCDNLTKCCLGTCCLTWLCCWLTD